jgi:hypothetical protein
MRMYLISIDNNNSTLPITRAPTVTCGAAGNLILMHNMKTWTSLALLTLALMGVLSSPSIPVAAAAAPVIHSVTILVTGTADIKMLDDARFVKREDGNMGFAYDPGSAPSGKVAFDWIGKYLHIYKNPGGTLHWDIDLRTPSETKHLGFVISNLSKNGEVHIYPLNTPTSKTVWKEDGMKSVDLTD